MDLRRANQRPHLRRRRLSRADEEEMGPSGEEYASPRGGLGQGLERAQTSRQCGAGSARARCRVEGDEAGKAAGVDLTGLECHPE